MSLKVNSETGVLKKVLLHKPDKGIELVTPENAVELLYEDIVFLPKMQAEHTELSTTLTYFIGKENTIEVSDLLEEILNSEKVREALLKEISDSEELSVHVLFKLFDIESKNLAEILITGYDYTTCTKYFHPLPNLIFTRDIGVMINNFLLISKSAKKARHRESILCNFIFNNHPLFKGQWSENKTLTVPENFTIEGGDIMMLEPGHLMVASSERTSEESLDFLVKELFSKKVVERVTRVALPKLRFCMHLDTIFTKLDKDTYIGYNSLISTSNSMKVLHQEKNKVSEFQSVEELLKTINHNSQIIYCGDATSPYAEREQWTDACNLFAVKNGVAFSYDRNFRTNRAFQEAGYQLIEASNLIQSFKEGSILPDEVERTIITISSSELSRARGGPHCMTMPLLRGE